MNITFELENLLSEAEMLNSMALASYEAIYNGAFDYREYDGQLLAVSKFASSFIDNLRALKDKVYETEKAKKKKDGEKT